MSMETVSTIGSRGGGKETVSTQPKLLGALCCRDYSRHTEQTYCQWVFPHENLWVSAKTGEQERHYVDDSIVQKARIYAFIILLVSALILSGCAPGPPGTITEPDPEDISRIKKVGLCVKVQKGFAVRLGYVSSADRFWLEQMLVDNLGRFLGSLAYGGVGILREYSPDRNATEYLKPEAAPVDSAEAIGLALSRKFRTAKIFPAVELVQPQSLTAAKEQGFDTLFILTVRRWGLRPPLGSKYATGDKAAAQLELDANLRLISSATRKVLWERNELYRDSECYSLGDFKSKNKKGLLANRMWYVLQLICDRTSNEIHRTP